MQWFRANRLVTCDPKQATAQDPLGVLEDGVLCIDNGAVAWIGRAADAQIRHGATVTRCALITPGLIDAHTHAAWMGSRHDEYAIRMVGGDYQAIAAAGGGIVASQRAIAAASEDEIATELHARVLRMAALGVTTVEVKSGYGLTREHELKQLRAIAAVKRRANTPNIVATLLALHAIPVAERTRRREYVQAMACDLVDEVAAEKLAEFVDAYVDRGAFDVAEARTLATRAKLRGLGVRLHVGQFADVGGAELAGEVGARSADHLENVSPAGIDALLRAGTCATLLPVASFTLGQTPPPARLLQDAGITLVVASDANPGTAPSESLPLALAFAVRLYGLTPAEALLGATRNAAISMNLWWPAEAYVPAKRPRGVLCAGAAADLVAWDLPHETCIMQPWGTGRTHTVLRDGVPLFERVPSQPL